MAEKITIAGKLQVPLEDGGTPAPFDLGADFVFTQRVNVENVYASATVDDDISFGTMVTGGAKVLLVKSPIGGCTIKLNGSALAIPVPPGGAYLLYVNPTGGFWTSAKVTTTGAATVKILALS